MSPRSSRTSGLSPGGMHREEEAAAPIEDEF
jgi:hypothetical protein